MLGNEIAENAIKFTYRGITLTANITLGLIKQYLETNGSKNVPNVSYGQQSLKRLNQKGIQLDSIPVTSIDLRGLRRELNSFGIDYAVRKSTTEMNSYEIYFKGRDINQIQTALKSYVTYLMKKGKKSTLKDQISAAIEKAKMRNENRKQSERKFEREHGER